MESSELVDVPELSMPNKWLFSPDQVSDVDLSMESLMNTLYMEHRQQKQQQQQISEPSPNLPVKKRRGRKPKVAISLGLESGNTVEPAKKQRKRKVTDMAVVAWNNEEAGNVTQTAIAASAVPVASKHSARDYTCKKNGLCHRCRQLVPAGTGFHCGYCREKCVNSGVWHIECIQPEVRERMFESDFINGVKGPSCPIDTCLCGKVEMSMVEYARNVSNGWIRLDGPVLEFQKEHLNDSASQIGRSPFFFKKGDEDWISLSACGPLWGRKIAGSRERKHCLRLGKSIECSRCRHKSHLTCANSLGIATNRSPWLCWKCLPRIDICLVCMRQLEKCIDAIQGDNGEPILGDLIRCATPGCSLVKHRFCTDDGQGSNDSQWFCPKCLIDH